MTEHRGGAPLHDNDEQRFESIEQLLTHAEQATQSPAWDNGAGPLWNERLVLAWAALAELRAAHGAKA
jgi:hypothetical protein